MNEMLNPNDISHVVEADKAHVLHHLTNHSKFDSVDPLIIVEGKGLRVLGRPARGRTDRAGDVSGIVRCGGCCGDL